MFVLALCGGVARAESGAPPDPDRALRVSQSVIGHAMGRYDVLDQLGRPIDTASLAGKPLVVSYVYTGCFEVCPTTTRFLADAVAAARKALGADSFRIMTIGFNQPFDGPQAMAAFARQNGIRDPEWLFVSPARERVNELLGDLGFTYTATAKGFDHILQTTVLDARGVVYRQIYGDSFELPMLIGPLKELMTGAAVEAGGWEGLARRVKLFCTVYDPVTGGYRLNYSLFVELFAGFSVCLAVIWIVVRERWRRPRAS
mgnify:CR=1 FL=1